MAQVRLDRLGRYDHVYLSPHLDDVAFSCPGHLLADREALRRVLVISLFTSGDDPAYERRMAEDARAMELLDVDSTWAGFTDAPFRPAGYRTFGRIVLGPRDLLATAGVASLLRQVIPDTRASLVVAPLGVGNHVDHEAVHVAATTLGARVAFYEDRPYALVPHAVRLRLAELGVRPRIASPLPVDAAAGSVRAPVPHLRSFLQDQEDREAWRRRLAELAAGAESPELGRAKAVTRWSPKRHLPIIERVMASYESQIEPVLGSVPEHLRACARPSRPEGRPAYVERLWELPR